MTYVLSHDHESVQASEFSAHDADLLGGDVVDIDEQASAVLAEGVLKVSPLVDLSLSLGKFRCHSKLRSFSQTYLIPLGGVHLLVVSPLK